MKPDSIRLRGVRQNNLKGFDLDLPLGRYIVVTGLSGAGKSSLVFDTLHAEGQRRYVETFSAYTRQFLELLDKPKVDSIENIRPSIAIAQTNTVRTSRSTVGTMTELTDFAKVWFSHVAECFDPETGERVEDDNPQTIWQRTFAAHGPGRAPGSPSATLLIAFKVEKPAKFTWTEILTSLKGQGYTRILADLLPARTGKPKIERRQPATAGRRVAPNAPASTHATEAPAGTPAALATHRIEDLLAGSADLHAALRQLHPAIFVVQDRLRLTADARSRFLEATETALHFGHGEVFLFREDASRNVASTRPPVGSTIPPTAGRVVDQTAGLVLPAGHFSRGLHSPGTGRTFRPATPALFSFNSPLGACPRCRGFGRVIDIDYRLAIPDHSLSIAQGAIRPWEGEIYGESKRDLLRFAKKAGLPVDVPFAALTDAQKSFVIEGSPGYDGETKRWPQYWYGLKGFFRYLEKTTYKMHVRVFLSRYRAYNPCPECHGARLQPEALCWKWQGQTLPELYQLPVSEFLALLREESPSAERRAQSAGDGANVPSLRHGSPASAATIAASGAQPSALSPQPASASHSAALALDSMLTRLRYLEQVGLGYLTLDRPSRTLSGGEVERVNLTSCLGTSLVDTLFVLDEPSVGLHPRDIDRLISIVRTLTDAGNTVVVVEHDEAMIRAADHVIEVGPEPGTRGGEIVFQGSVPELLASGRSLTGRYLSGALEIPVPPCRRPVAPHPPPLLRFTNASKHNIRNLSFALPLQRLVCLSGVSGSGKSTLLDNVIHQGLLAQRGQMTEDPAAIERIDCELRPGATARDEPRRGSTGVKAGPARPSQPSPSPAEIVLVDQSPLSRTPRSNPALYCEAWDLIRELYAATPAAQEAGLTAASFSFNSGDGRCDHCQGLGSERVEMQFLSDVFVPCPICEGRRFQPQVLTIQWNGRSVADLLATTVDDAIAFFNPGAAGSLAPRIAARLAALQSVGLGYLPLGQPLNTLSGGESQRLKLVRYLADIAGEVRETQVPDFQDPTATEPSSFTSQPSSSPGAALLLLDEPTTGLHRHDVKRLLGVLQRIVDRGHSLVVIEHNLDVLKCADWIIEIGPDAGANGGRIIAEGPPEAIAAANTPTGRFLAPTLGERLNRIARAVDLPLRNADPPAGPVPPTDARIADQTAGLVPTAAPATASTRPPVGSTTPPSPFSPSALCLVGARENNLKNISLAIPHRQLSVITGVSGSGKSTLAFDIIFAEGQRRFMESMSPYARQFVEQLPRPDIDRLTGIPPTVAIEQRITRGSRKSTVATITEIAQYLRLLYARLGRQHHPETGRPVTPLSPGQLRQLLARTLATPAARKARHLYLCAPLIRGRKGHHEPIARWIARHGYPLMRADGRLLKPETFAKLDRYREHDIEVVIADLKALDNVDQTAGLVPTAASPTSEGSKPKSAGSPATRRSRARQRADPPAAGLRPSSLELRPSLNDALADALRLGKGTCFLLTPAGEILSWFSTTRTDIETGESFPELDPKHFSFNSPRGWCPTCRGHGRIFDWMLQPDEDDEVSAEVRDALRTFDPDEPAPAGRLCPTCHGERLNRIARAVRLPLRNVDQTAGPVPPNAPISHPHSPIPARSSGLSLPELLRLAAPALIATLHQLDLDERGRLITQDILPQIEERLRFLAHVGLDYLSLDRPTGTLSGGEAQRIRLAAQLGSNLSGVLYVLDEPSIGLHARDNDRLTDTLASLRDKGNTLLVVEHDDVVMERADRIIDLGPGAGVHGGEVLANDTPAAIKGNATSLTGLFLARGIPHPLRGAYRPVVSTRPPVGSTTPPRVVDQTAGLVPSAADATPWLRLTEITHRNLQAQSLLLPVGRLIMVCGPSGAGKSTLFRDLLHPAVTTAIKQRKSRLSGKAFLKLVPDFETEIPEPKAVAGPPTARRQLAPPGRKPPPSAVGLSPPRRTAPRPPPFAHLHLPAPFKAVIEVDQSPIGKTPRSTPATYLGIFDMIRQFFASLPESKLRGYTASRFSFNVPGGRCEACAGAGRIKLAMAFMADSYLPCDACGGSRFSPELADITWKGKTIGDVLKLSFDEAVGFFGFHSQLSQVCQLMTDCGLGYLTLGQSSPTLSGGEAQRLKLVTELTRGLASYRERTRGLPVRNLYLLEEPTIGLHLSDCEKLIKVLQNLVDQGHTVVVIEHHLDLLAEADWIIELGPGGGPHGGQILYQGPLAGLLAVPDSPTAPYLRPRLAPHRNSGTR